MSWLRALFHRPTIPPRPASDSTPDLEATLLEAEQMAAELIAYLLGDRLYWQIVVDTPLGLRQPKMTLGALWERIERLGDASELGPHDRQRLLAVQETWDAARRRYPDPMRDKLQRELDSSLRNWRYYLGQRASDPERWQSEYDVEARHRQRAELLARLLGPDAPPDLFADLDDGR